MIYYPSHEVFRYQNFCTLSKLSEQLLEATPLYFTAKNTKLMKLYCSHLFNILIVRQFIVNQPSDKKNCTFPISNLSCTPKLMQRYYKLSKIEKNGMIGIFFFCKIVCLQLIVEEKILKHRLSSGGVVSPNQRCRQRNNCLRGLNQDEGFISKFVLVTRQGGG